MGIGLGRIEKEFILKAVADQGIPVRLFGAKMEKEVSVISYDEEKIALVAEGETWEKFQPDDPVSLFFSYYGHYMTFNTRVRYTQGEKLYINFPQGIYKNLQRKFIRIQPPEGSKVEFLMKGTKIELDFPKTEEFNSADVLEYSNSFKSTDITELLSGFKEKIKTFVSSHKIIMFRDRDPEGFEEELISTYGRSLFIQSVDDGFPVEEPSAQAKTLTKKDIEEALKRSGVQEQNIPIRLSVLLSEKKNNRIHAEVYTPILFHEYAVGFIYAVNKDDNEDKLDIELLEYIDQFSKVLSYSLKINGYFKDVKPKDVNYEAQIIDISASGLLFIHSSKELASALMLYTDLEITFHLGEKMMTIPARIMRKYNDSGYDYYGLLFLDMKEEDFRVLFELIYGRSYNQEDEESWEGGAPPPEIDLFS